jgi:hypothetical protein
MDESVSDWVATLLMTTFPNEIDAALILSLGWPDDNCSENVAEVPPPVAVSVALWADVHEAAVAVNPTDLAPAAMATLDGTVTTELLLPSATLRPVDGAAVVKVTVHASVPAPDIELLAQEREPTVDAGIPAPVRFSVRLPCDELVAMDRVPENALATCGLNFTASVAV